MLITNTLLAYRTALDPAAIASFGRDAAERAARFMAARPGYAPTPLLALPAFARELGIASLSVKDEGARFGLGSFKALGGGYAVAHLVLEEAGSRLGTPLDASDLARPDVRDVAASMTFACATDGNHGRSVAQGAAAVGARAVVFVHRGVSRDRVEAIARFGATMVRVDGTYDDSVREAATTAHREGWTVVSDTGWPGYERIPAMVMQGYTVMVREALRALDAPPTHTFVQAGVGGLAAAVAAHLADAFGDTRSRVVVVEPARAACVLESVRAGAPVRIPHGEPTVMAMLECYEPSLVAWPILARQADAFMAVDEEDAIATMRRLAVPHAGDPPLVAGESGCVGVAGLVRAAGDPAWRTAIGLDERARVLAFITEGATDPVQYRALTGLDPQGVASHAG